MNKKQTIFQHLTTALRELESAKQECPADKALSQRIDKRRTDLGNLLVEEFGSELAAMVK